MIVSELERVVGDRDLWNRVMAAAWVQRKEARKCTERIVLVAELEQVVGDRGAWSWVMMTAWMKCGLSSIFPPWEGV